MQRRCLLLDRDGVVNVDHGYVGKIEQFTFNLGLFPFLRAAQDRGYRLAIVTNQAGVARGYYTEQDYQKLTDWMLRAFQKEDIAIDLVLACFEHKDGSVPTYARPSFWRKPNPGMILEASQKLRLDLARSAMLGDHERDMKAALAAGVGNCLWLNGPADPALPNVISVADFAAALAALP